MSTIPPAAIAHPSLVSGEITDLMSSDEFKSVFRHHAAGVAVVTAQGPDGPVAMTVTSLFSISAEPPMFVFSASAFSSVAPAIREADTVVAHLLHDDHLGIGRLGATSGADRFSVPWHRLPTGEPVYDGVPTWVRGRIVARLDAGTSTLLVAEALEGSTHADAPAPLVYHNRTWHALTERSAMPAPHA